MTNHRNNILYTNLILLYCHCFLITRAIPLVNGFVFPQRRFSTIQRIPSHSITDSNQQHQRDGRSDDALVLPRTMAWGTDTSSAVWTLASSSVDSIEYDTNNQPEVVDDVDDGRPVDADIEDVDTVVDEEEDEEDDGRVTKLTYAEQADKLVTLLVQRHNRQPPTNTRRDNTDEPSSSVSSSSSNDEEIERLMQSLEDAQLPFDPQTSLNGPLFAALYQKTGDAVPFWETYSQILRPAGGKQNIKGQRYSVVDDGENGGRGGGEKSYELTNYAEFFGDAFNVQASAICVRNINQPATTANAAPSSSTQQQPSGDFLSNLSAKVSTLLSSFTNTQSSSKLLPTPHDYTINVSGASICLLGNTFNFKIKGTGYLRVLYADPCLRIFTVPKDTTNEFINEKAGLTVAQVRVDLVDSSFSM